MPFTAKDVMVRCSAILHDEQHRRWPLEELLRWINDGVIETALAKPTAVTHHVEMNLIPGSWQQISGNQFEIMAATRNLRHAEDEQGGRQGEIITTLESADTLDQTVPGWTDTNIVPASPIVQHAVKDIRDPRSFFVYPPNDGHGKIEAIVAEIPEDLATPETPEDLESYAALAIPLPTIYRPAITNYVLYRAHSKDNSLPASAGRAQAALSLWASLVGSKMANDRAAQLSDNDGALYGDQA